MLRNTCPGYWQSCFQLHRKPLSSWAVQPQLCCDDKSNPWKPSLLAKFLEEKKNWNQHRVTSPDETKAKNQKNCLVYTAKNPTSPEINLFVWEKQTPVSNPHPTPPVLALHLQFWEQNFLVLWWRFFFILIKNIAKDSEREFYLIWHSTYVPEFFKAS